MCCGAASICEPHFAHSDVTPENGPLHSSLCEKRLGDHVASVNVQNATDGGICDKQTYKTQRWHSVFGFCTCRVVKNFFTT